MADAGRGFYSIYSGELNVRSQQATVVAWAKNYLNINGCTLQDSPEMVHEEPWACVHRISTSTGVFYLKQMVPSFAIEPDLINVLKHSFPALLPEIVSINKALHCFLMRDAGTPLRTILCNHYQVDLAIKGLTVYATIQQGAANHTDALLDLGVSDWRLATMPSLYLALLNKDSFLKSDGLMQTEIDQLKSFHHRVAALCHQLAQYSIPETIEHGDFHDNNILINVHNDLIVNDWGEAVITHPFFSCVDFLVSAARQHNIIEGSETYNVLRDGYLNHWLAFENKDRLFDAFNLVKQLGYIKYSLSFYPITQCPGWHESGQNKGRITQALRLFLHLQGQ